MTPDVSIIIPTKNRRPLLEQTLASVRAQTHGNWEAIIADDGSTDSTVAYVQQLARSDPRFRLLCVGAGLAGGNARRNDGVVHARAEYVIFLDSDDMLSPHCLSHRLEVMKARPDLDMAIFPCQLFHTRIGDVPLLWNCDSDEDDLDRNLRMDPPWQTTGPIWRLRSLRRLGDRPWDEQAPSWQEWDLHIRALVAGFRYERFAGVDCHWRQMQENRDSIGLQAFTPRHLRGRKRLLFKLHRLIAEAGMLTDRRRLYFAGLFFLNAERAARMLPRRPARAVRYWRDSRPLGLVDRWLFGEILNYFHWWRVYPLRGCLRRLLRMRWPAITEVGHSTTHLRTPVPEPGAAGQLTEVAA